MVGLRTFPGSLNPLRGQSLDAAAVIQARVARWYPRSVNGQTDQSPNRPCNKVDRRIGMRLCASVLRCTVERQNTIDLLSMPSECDARIGKV
jgi:hypothetical protein